MNANTRNFEVELAAENAEVEEAPKVGSEAEALTAKAI